MMRFAKTIKIRLFLFATIAALFLTGCSAERGGVIVDSSGEQGGGTQPGGGGFAFVLLAVMIFICVAAMFAMDRIKKRKLRSESDESSDQN